VAAMDIAALACRSIDVCGMESIDTVGVCVRHWRRIMDDFLENNATVF